MRAVRASERSLWVGGACAPQLSEGAGKTVPAQYVPHSCGKPAGVRCVGRTARRPARHTAQRAQPGTPRQCEGRGVRGRAGGSWYDRDWSMIENKRGWITNYNTVLAATIMASASRGRDARAELPTCRLPSQRKSLSILEMKTRVVGEGGSLIADIGYRPRGQRRVSRERPERGASSRLPDALGVSRRPVSIGVGAAAAAGARRTPGRRWQCVWPVALR